MLRSTRLHPPVAHDVVVELTWGSKVFSCASLEAARGKAREVRSADRGHVTRVRILPAA